MIIVSVAAVLVLVGLATLRPALSEDQHTLTVMFPRTTNLYEGAKVKVLGVPVGTVDAIEVEGTEVRVSISYDPDVRLPADVHAVIVPPSVVGDRFIQLAPAYTGGDVLADGAELGIERSGVPLELDDTYRALDKVAGSLGPDGVNDDGALSRFISAGADNLRGRGRLLNATVRELADAIGVLAGSSGDFQGTTSNLNRLTRRLSESDGVLRSLVVSLVAVATELNGQGSDITAAVTTLDRALGRVATFAKDNRATLRDSLADLTSVSRALRRHTRELEEISDLAPVGLVNLLNTYVPRNWDPTNRGNTTVDGRTGSQNLHAALFEDLNTQLSYAFGAFCSALPPEAGTQLAPFCTALAGLGGDLGALLQEAYDTEVPLDPSPREVAEREAQP
ncbi:MCE family protein [Nocardioides stalactiti]|uniref:MCE family protein n=1 Tax=Nocardioides stalactiti TaxID=2755356 RepID=UPI001FE5AE82|nr:MCE family protein [Nocardioides stalactiti]